MQAYFCTARPTSVHGPADRDILFDGDNDSKYGRALARIGVDPGMLSVQAGHA